MRINHLFAVVAVGLVAGTALAGREPKPKEHRYIAEHYRVTVPAGEDRDHDSKRVSYGPAAEQVFEIATDRWEADRVVLAVTVASFPEAFAAVPPAVLLEGARQGLVGPPNMGGKLVEEGPNAADPATGRRVHIAAGKVHVRARLVVVGRRLFQVTATGSASAVAGPVAEGFLNGFAVKE